MHAVERNADGSLKPVIEQLQEEGLQSEQTAPIEVPKVRKKSGFISSDDEDVIGGIGSQPREKEEAGQGDQWSDFKFGKTNQHNRIDTMNIKVKKAPQKVDAEAKALAD